MKIKNVLKVPFIIKIIRKTKNHFKTEQNAWIESIAFLITNGIKSTFTFSKKGR